MRISVYYSIGVLLMNSWMLTARLVSPDLAVNRKGDIVLVWSDGQDIFASYNRNNLETEIASMKIGALTGQDNHPVVALDDQGNGIVVWDNVCEDTIRIYMRPFGRYFINNGEIIPVADSELSVSQSAPDVAIEGSGNALIVWVDYRYWNADILGRLFKMESGIFGPEFKINDDTSTAKQNFPSVEAGKDRFIVIWEDHRRPHAFIYGQILQKNSVMKGNNFCVNDTEFGSSWEVFASAAITESGSFIIIWKDYRNGNSDIYAQKFNARGKPSGGNIRVNDDPGAGWQRLAVITVIPDHGFLAIWEDYRHDDVINQKGDIYSQPFDKDFRPVNGNILINHSSEPSAQTRPLIAALPGQNALILWEDERTDRCHFSYQYLNAIKKPPNCFQPPH